MSVKPGQAHTDFDTAGLSGSDAVVNAVAAHVAWARGNLDDHVWMGAMRRMYRSGLSWRGGWSVAKHHSYYWSELGESVDTVAYVNAARCQWPGPAPADFAEFCVRELSLVPLVEALRPRLVISNSAAAFAELVGVVPTLYVHQLNGRNWVPVEVESPSGRVLIDVGKREPTAVALSAAGFRRAS